MPPARPAAQAASGNQPPGERPARPPLPHPAAPDAVPAALGAAGILVFILTGGGIAGTTP